MSEQSEETREAIEHSVVAPVIEIPPATIDQAQRVVRRAEHIFDPPDALPVEITANRERPFRFTRDFRYRIVARGKTVLDIEIEKGFECDLGSFPWWARWMP